MVRTLVLTLVVAGALLAAWMSLRPAPTPQVTQTSQPPATTPRKEPLMGPEGEPITPAEQTVAREHIEAITPPEQMPLNVSRAQHFVTADQLLQLPLKQIRTDAQLEQALSAAPPAGTSHTAQTAEQTHQSTETTHPEENSSPQSPQLTDVTAEPLEVITVTQGQAATAVKPSSSAVTVRAVADAGLMVVPGVANAQKATENGTPSTAQEIQSLQINNIASDGSQIKLKELLDHPERSKDKIFYLHAVHQDDDQGLWGIIQTALVNSFAEGIDLGDVTDKASAQIPDNADERLWDKRSSFLGHILQRKVRESYIYNYEKGTLGRNPDLIQPGQQLVIITFTEDELIQIYQFFATP